MFLSCAVIPYGAPETDSWQVGLLPARLTLRRSLSRRAKSWQVANRCVSFSSGGRSILGEGGWDKWEGVHERQLGPGEMGLGGAVAWTLMRPLHGSVLGQ